MVQKLNSSSVGNRAGTVKRAGDAFAFETSSAPVIVCSAFGDAERPREGRDHDVRISDDAHRKDQPSPLGLVLAENVLGTHVEVDLCRRQVIVAKDPLQRRQRDALADRIDGERMTEDMWRCLPREPGAVRKTTNDAMHRPRGECDAFVKREVCLEQ